MFSNALYWYNSGLEKRPNDIFLLISKGNTLFHLYFYNDALASYYKALCRSKKLLVFHRFINKNILGSNYNFKDFINRLHKTHKLKIEPIAIPRLLEYVQHKKDEKTWMKEFLKFKKQFDKNTLHNLNDFVDEYLWKYGINYHFYFQRFHEVLLQKGFNITPDELYYIIFTRDSYWKSISPSIYRLIAAIDRMTGVEFEIFIKNFFKNRGYHTRLTKKSYDAGGDIIINRNNESIAVQCKRWNETVRSNAIQEIHTARDVYQTQRAMVITTNFFSKGAYNLAQKVNVELWDRTNLMQELIKDNYY